MINDVLKRRIEEYAPEDTLEQENVLQEIMQHYVLTSLSRAGIFSEVIFHGGTCLRIINRTNRYSEDLDFLLKKPDLKFRWQFYLDRVGKDCAQEGIDFELIDKANANTAVQKAFLKTDSIGKVLLLNLPFDRHNGKKIRITGQVTIVEGLEKQPVRYDDNGNAIIQQGRQKDTKFIEAPKIEIIDN